MEKRTEKITINLTRAEFEMLERITEHNDRKLSEQARILVLRSARNEWAIISNLNPSEELKPNYEGFNWKA